ncbi:MAG: PPC domain-containing protein [Gemmataceae bacterium]
MHIDRPSSLVVFSSGSERKEFTQSFGWSRCVASLLGTLVILTSVAQLASAQTFMRARLDAITPTGAKAGTTVEVVLRGNDLDEVKELYFSDSRIKAQYVPPPEPKDKKKKPTTPPPPKFKITVPANVPVGKFDVRAVGKWGISNPRAFVVGALKEIIEKENNSLVTQAQPVELNSTINGSINSRTDVDYFLFEAKKGQTVTISCDASTIDSKLTPTLEVYDSNDRLLVAGSDYRDRNAVVAFTAKADGKFYARLHEPPYIAGGADYFYRLTISTGPWIDSAFPPVIQEGKSAKVTLYGKNLPGGKIIPNQEVAGSAVESAVVNIAPPDDGWKTSKLDFDGLQLLQNCSLSGFGYRVKNGNQISNPVLITYTKNPVVTEKGDNDNEAKGQEISLPTTVCGMIEDAADQDHYVFSAKKGEVYTVEGFADRFGPAMNVYLQIIQLGKNRRVLATYDDHNELPSNLGNLPFYTLDPKGRFTVPADGKYALLVQTYTSNQRYGPRFVYRIDIQKAEPDFRVLVVDNDTANIGGLTIYRGGAESVKVVVVRQEGFNGAVKLEATGLPKGVKCAPQIVGPLLKSGVLVLEAEKNAPDWAGTFRIKATATINGKQVVREVIPGAVVWVAPNNVPRISRLARSFCLAVRKEAPYSLEPEKRKMEAPLGGRVEVKVKTNRQWKGFNSQVQLVRLAAPALTNGNFLNTPNVNIAKGKNEGVIKFQIPTNSVPGTYSLVFEGRAKYQYQPNPKDKKKRNVDIYVATPPIEFEVYNKVAEVELATPKVMIKAGETRDIVVKVNRLHKYDGEFTVQFISPRGVGGISVAAAKITKGKNEVKLTLKTAKNLKPLSRSDFVIRVSARVNNVTFTHEANLALTVTKATAARPQLRLDRIAGVFGPRSSVFLGK